jgi:hypothetical protein
MSLFDYIEDNWRDSYKPFTRYPEIYGEHFEQGKGLLTEEGQGWSSLYKKPLGLLNVSGIPALYEAFRDEPIRDNLINAGMDSDKAGYATQAIGTALDIGVPWAVMKKGMTPWVSEYAVSKANPAKFDPSKRKLLQGAGAATALAATGNALDLLPAGTTGKVAKQAAKSSAAFGGLLSKMNTALKSVGANAGGKAIVSKSMIKFEEGLGRLAAQLSFSRSRHIDSIRDSFPRNSEEGYKAAKQYGKDHPSVSWGNDDGGISGPDIWGRIHPSSVDEVGRLRKEYEAEGKPGQAGVVHDRIAVHFAELERARADYHADPTGFANGMNIKMKSLRDGIVRDRARLSFMGPSRFRGAGQQIVDSISRRSELLSQMEQFLKELKAGS